MAVVRFALRQRESIALLRVRGKVIVLQTMLWPDEVREPEFDILDTEVELRPQELTMAASLVESLGADFDPTGFHDDYRDAVVEMIERKRTTGETRPAPVEQKAGDEGDSMTDLLSALQASVDAARAKSGSAPKEPAPKEPAKPRAAAAKKPAAPRKPANKDESDEKAAPRKRTRKPA
jgi:DNA end-binding protein Ku